MMKKNWIVILIIVSVFFLNNPPLKAAPGEFSPESVENAPTVQLKINFTVKGSNDQIYFLLENLPLTCTIIRILKLDNFRARKIKPRYFQARDKAGLRGYLYYHNLSTGALIATGEGTHTTSRIPFDIHGKTSVNIALEPVKPQKTAVGATISIRISNRILHYTGRILAPIVRRVARSKTNNLKKVARNFFVLAAKNKYNIETQLNKIDGKMGVRWTKYPGF